ncbi:MAG: nucleotidyltransferase domain-containing protein [Thermoleophilia bacterium]|nr:nucleotidyltransferase domain-containing protein [Thermoleophilia bacterium]
MTVLDELVGEVEADPGSIGLILHGSRAAGVHTPDSDFDLVRVLTDDAFDERRARGELREKRPGPPGADVVFLSRSRLRERAESTDGYTAMFVTAQVVVDTHDEVEALLAAIVEAAGLREQAELDEHYDGYLNTFVRSLKAWRRGDELGGRLQAAHSALCLIRLLFAAEGKLAPYHDQLRRPLAELERAQGWEEGFLRDALTRLVATGDPTFQQELELRVEALFESRGIAHQWGPEDDLQRLKDHDFR